MITMNADSMDEQCGAMIKAFEKFPAHIAKRHLKSAMKKALKFAVPVLKSKTPVGVGKRDGEGKRVKGSRGSLKKAAQANAKFEGKNKGGFVVGSISYKFGLQSRKAIWIEYGTAGGMIPRDIMAQTFNQVRGEVAGQLTRELAHAMEKAAKDLAPGVESKYRRK